MTEVPSVVLSSSTLSAIQQAAVDETTGHDIEGKEVINLALIITPDPSHASRLAGIISTDHEPPVLQISNKYYTAHVPLRPLGTDEMTSSAALEAQAVILAFDASDAASFKLVTAAWAATACADDFEEPSALLLVPVYSGGKCPCAVDDAEQDEWAIEHGAEAISGVDLSAPSSAQNELDADGCTQGIARVREALEVVCWPITGEPSAAPKPRPKPLAAECEEKPVVPELTEEKAMSNLMKGLDPCNLPEDQDQLERAFAKVAEVRHLAQSANLPDKERRRMAADTAIALMESLGLVDDGESEDDVSSDSD